MPTAFGFRPYTNRNVMRSGLPVCVCAVYNPVGDFKPIAFGAVMEGMRYRFKIKTVTLVRDSHGEIVFDCEYVELGLVKAVRLVYLVNECRWLVG